MTDTNLAAKAKSKIRKLATDGWENLTTGLGTARDKRTLSQIKPVNATATRSTLDDMYHGDDIARTIAGKAPEDMVRKWIDISVELGEEGESENEAETADDTLQALNDLDAKGAFREALTWARVYGGGMIFVGVDDGAGDNIEALAEPVNESRVRSIDFLQVFDRFDVEIETEYDDHADGMAKFGTPKTYRIQNLQGVRGSNLPSLVVHESRFLRFDGPITSRQRRIRNNGWNDSVYTRIEQLLADYGTSWGSVAHLLQDFAAGVYKMDGLAAMMSGEDFATVYSRLQSMDLCRSTVRMTPIDSELEDYQRMTTPVTGLADLLHSFMLRVSSAAEMPVTVLFGASPSGLNSTAEGDLSVWYDRVGSMQETDLRPQIMRLINLLFLAAEGPTKGRTPDGWELTFNPLWQLDEKELAEARKTQADTDAIYIDTNVLEPDEVAASRFGGESYSFDTVLDKEAREAEPATPTVAEPVAQLETEV